jgi:hypothetical protein
MASWGQRWRSKSKNSGRLPICKSTGTKETVGQLMSIENKTIASMFEREY